VFDRTYAKKKSRLACLSHWPDDNWPCLSQVAPCPSSFHELRFLSVVPILHGLVDKNQCFEYSLREYTSPIEYADT
jgi:hypothetical protein